LRTVLEEEVGDARGVVGTAGRDLPRRPSSHRGETI